MFVFGEVQDPLPETVKLVEDVVRGQVIEMVTRARLLTHLRSSRFLSSEDIVFLIRDDRGKVNRLRTYLSWKDVRKKAKEDQEGDLDVEDAGTSDPCGEMADLTTRQSRAQGAQANGQAAVGEAHALCGLFAQSAEQSRPGGHGRRGRRGRG